MGMLPSNIRILTGIKNALDELERLQLPQQSAAFLVPLRLAVNELALRENAEFFREHCTRGSELAERGAQLLHKHGLGGIATAPPTPKAAVAAMDAIQLRDMHDAL